MSQFPLTCPAAMAVMLLTLTTILVAAYHQEFNEAFYKLLPSGYTYGYIRRNPSEKFIYGKSLLECSYIALNNQSEFFTYDKLNHVCKNYSPKSIMTVVRTNDTNEIAFYRHSQWIKTYAISKGAKTNVLYSYVNYFKPVYWAVDKCFNTFCPNLFRHPILDFWDNLPIDEVKLVIYKNQTDVATMIFNGRNTTLESWFSQENLKSSPWDDLASATGLTFSIRGFENRRFYIAKHGGCAGDSGWLAILETTGNCPYERNEYHPMIRYSDRKTRVIWHNSNALADSMAIFIHLGEWNNPAHNIL